MVLEPGRLDVSAASSHSLGISDFHVRIGTKWNLTDRKKGKGGKKKKTPETFPLIQTRQRSVFSVTAPFPAAKKPNSIYVKQGLKDLGIKAINWLLSDLEPR